MSRTDLQITRRDFLNGVLMGAGSALLGAPMPLLAQRSMPTSLGASWYGYGGIGDYASSHGNTPEVVTQSEPLSMSWCLDCHRNPAPHLRPTDEVTNMDWFPPQDQAEFARRAIEEKQLSPPVDCSGCHR